MIANIFAFIQLLLKLFGLWEQFSDWTIKQAIAKREERRQDRDKAVDQQQNAQTEEEFDKAQETISHNLPRP
jgi:hypothetical protein